MGGAEDPAVVAMLLQGFASSDVGLCLCDETDTIRHANAVFRTRFIPTWSGEQGNFVDALTDSIVAGRGIRLTTQTVAEFSPRLKVRRRAMQGQMRFAVGLYDGSWWWANDQKLANGWLMAVLTEISSLKDEEFRLRHAHEAALRASQTDFLTGLANRRRGFELGEQAIADATENNQPFSIAVLDIDHFKRINDSHGHDVGDAVLVHFAALLATLPSVRDSACRIGGEEFLLLMPGTTAGRAQRRLRQLLDRLRPLVIAGVPEPVRFTVSAGVACADGASFKDLVRRADLAVYAAKARGRNRIVLDRFDGGTSGETTNCHAHHPDYLAGLRQSSDGGFLTFPP